MALLEVRDLKVQYKTRAGIVKAVDGVSYWVDEGETLGIVGESGCGKSQTSLGLMRLIKSPGIVAGGEVLYNGRDLTQISEQEMQAVRGNEIAMIFQDPMTSLNPVLKISTQLTEGLIHHKGMTMQQARARALELMNAVQIPAANDRLDAYPHQFSGGMRQRVMIAMALACNPKVLICDEPTTALDVTIQAQILELISELQKEFGTAVIMITHDMGVVAEVADRVAVMYAGRIIEHAPTNEIFDHPQHPYTEALLGSLPSLDDALEGERLESIPGLPPDLINPPSGCKFHPRCKYRTAICSDRVPPLIAPIDEDAAHVAACWHPAIERAEVGLVPRSKGGIA
ncbi:MAG: ABC transporter ATP-binding protein [Thermoleophilia bacterium]|nr:ABC transporter ATP-binding protein [Thermoleophilia bacterium]